MKHSNLVFLIIGVAIIFFGCSKDDFLAPELDQSDQVTASLKSAKPSSNLTGTMNLIFNLVWAGEEDVPVWEGTIDIEDHGVFGIGFFHYPSFKDKDYSQAGPFSERFEIYDLINRADVYLGGPDNGVASWANSKFRMNGEIDTANEPFEGWMGRNVHMSGVIIWRNLGTPEEPIMVPATAPATLRIN